MGDQRLGRFEAKDACHGRIGDQVAPARCAVKNALQGVFKDAVIARLSFLARLIGTHPLGDIQNEAFVFPGVGRHIVDRHAALCDPMDGTVQMLQAILQRVARTAPQPIGAHLRDALAILRMNQIGIAHAAVAEQIVGHVSREPLATTADEFHRPLRIVAAAEHHAVEIAHQRAEHARRLGRQRLSNFHCSVAPAVLIAPTGGELEQRQAISTERRSKPDVSPVAAETP